MNPIFLTDSLFLDARSAIKIQVVAIWEGQSICFCGEAGKPVSWNILLCDNGLPVLLHLSAYI